MGELDKIICSLFTHKAWAGLQMSGSRKCKAAPCGKVSQEAPHSQGPSSHSTNDRPGDGTQVQPRVQAIRQYHGDEEGPRWSWEVSPQVRFNDQVEWQPERSTVTRQSLGQARKTVCRLTSTARYSWL